MDDYAAQIQGLFFSSLSHQNSGHLLELIGNRFPINKINYIFTKDMIDLWNPKMQNNVEAVKRKKENRLEKLIAEMSMKYYCINYDS